MATTSTGTIQRDITFSYVQWGPILAGALAAAALAFVLHSFAAAIGLSVASTSPTWRDASFALWLTSGLYLVLVALASYGLGGYIAGRMRALHISEDTLSAASQQFVGNLAAQRLRMVPRPRRQSVHDSTSLR